jgi:DnaK suppressor protein
LLGRLAAGILGEKQGSRGPRRPIVVNQSLRLDAAYIERKRQQLMKLRDELRSTTEIAETDESNANRDSNLQAHEYEDDAQKLDTLEREGNLVARDVVRLAQVERALKKIEEGSYGVSDVSGHPIPKERLEAMPEAINTLSEQKADEGRD